MEGQEYVAEAPAQFSIIRGGSDTMTEADGGLCFARPSGLRQKRQRQTTTLGGSIVLMADLTQKIIKKRIWTLLYRLSFPKTRVFTWIFVR